MNRHFFSVLVAGLVRGCPGWPISSDTDRLSGNAVFAGKRVRAGGSASRIIGDQGTTDPGGGDGGWKRGQPAWQFLVGHGLRHTFTTLGSYPTEVRGQDNRQLPVRTKVVLGNRNMIMLDTPIGMGGGSSSVVPPTSGARKHGRGIRPAGRDRRSPQKVKDGQMDVSENIIVVSDGPVVRENTRVVPLSVTVPNLRVADGKGSDGSRNCVPSR